MAGNSSPKYIWYRKQRYYRSRTFNSYREAMKEAKQNQRRTRTKYYILKWEGGFLFPSNKYTVYYNKLIHLGGG